MTASITEWPYRLVGRAGQFGPDLLIELILPGGSVLALLLWLYQRNHRKA